MLQTVRHFVLPSPHPVVHREPINRMSNVAFGVQPIDQYEISSVTIIEIKLCTVLANEASTV